MIHLSLPPSRSFPLAKGDICDFYARPEYGVRAPRRVYHKKANIVPATMFAHRVRVIECFRLMYDNVW